jgi:hypothetical protein
MPFNDGPGPQGAGPGSGRGRGACVGRRSGFGRGVGAGRRNRFGQQQGGGSTPPDQQATLESEASFLEAQLAKVKRQISTLPGEMDVKE